MLRGSLDNVNMVNAAHIAKERDIEVSEVRTEREGDYHTLIRLTVETDRFTRDIAGTLFAEKRPRLVQIKGISVDAELGPHMLYVTNEDKPGMIGNLGTTLGDNKINIATFALGRSAPGPGRHRADRDRRPDPRPGAGEGAQAAQCAPGQGAGILTRMATRRRIRLKSLPPLPERSEEENDRLVKAHQKKLVRIQQALLFTGERAVVVFEGMDAAGKGGTIRRLAWAMDPRSLKVWPIGAPNEIEAKQHYLQRFWTRLPEKTQISVFDRSWYGRVLVERVEGFTPRKDWQRAYREINEFERQLVDNGFRVVKIFLHISKEQQREELIERLRDPLKRWKLSYDDFRNRAPLVRTMSRRSRTCSTAPTPRSRRGMSIPSDDKPAARARGARHPGQAAEPRARPVAAAAGSQDRPHGAQDAWERCR